MTDTDCTHDELCAPGICDCCDLRASGLEYIGDYSADDERTFTQIGTVTIDGDVYGVVGLDADEGGAAVCEHGTPGEILFFAWSDRADWPDARRAMEAAGYWTAA